MNILISAYYAAPCSGNFIGSMMDLGLKMRENGDNLVFVFPQTQNTIKEDSWVHWLERSGFKVYLVDTSESNEQQLNFLKDILKEKQIDILHIHFDLFLNFAKRNRKELPVHILVHEHMEYPAGKNRSVQALKFAAKSFQYRKENISIACVNRYVNMAHFGTKHWFLPNGLSLKRNTDDAVEVTRDLCREQLGIRPDEKLVMFLGWQLYRKGLDVAVKAVNECRKTDPKVVLGVIGLGTAPNIHQDGLAYIKDRTGISPAEEWIRYLPNTEDMFAYHRAADVYLSSSRSEAFSYGILEAISQNTPVVVSDIKGTSWCQKYTKAIAYPVENSVKCAEAIQKALDMGSAPSNQGDMCAEYDIGSWCIKMQEIYREIYKPRRETHES